MVVTHQSANDLRGLANSLRGQLRNGDEVAVVDNASSDGTAELARSYFGADSVIDTGANIGFAAACHIGVRTTRSSLLLFLNPDSRPHKGCIEQLRSASKAHCDWSAWQAAVFLDDGRINTHGGVAHYLGIGWAGGCGQPASELPERDSEITFPSGAALVVRRDAWFALEGLDPAYFMYGEDLDLGLRLWLSGHRVGVARNAHVTHGYEFDKGAYKWFLLERNRWRTVLSVYPIALLVLVLPALLAAELGLLVVAAQQGWLRAKMRAQVAVVRDGPRILVRRRKVQAMRRIGAAEFASHLTASLDSPYLAAAHNSLVSKPQTLYWRTVRLILELVRRAA